MITPYDKRRKLIHLLDDRKLFVKREFSHETILLLRGSAKLNLHDYDLV